MLKCLRNDASGKFGNCELFWCICHNCWCHINTFHSITQQHRSLRKCKYVYCVLKARLNNVCWRFNAIIQDSLWTFQKWIVCLQTKHTVFCYFTFNMTMSWYMCHNGEIVIFLKWPFPDELCLISHARIATYLLPCSILYIWNFHRHIIIVIILWEFHIMFEWEDVKSHWVLNRRI